jgi:hypothetical protein
LSADDATLASLKNSSAWTNSQSITARFASQGATLVKYDNSPIVAIIFSLESSMNFENLVFLGYKDKFIAVKAKSVNEGGLTRLSVTDLNDATYYQFYVNKENKMGKFTVGMDIPFSQLGNGKALRTELAAPTCTSSTSSFGDCMKCGINECANDWVCAVACSVMAAQCLIGFGLACGAAQM